MNKIEHHWSEGYASGGPTSEGEKKGRAEKKRKRESEKEKERKLLQLFLKPTSYSTLDGKTDKLDEAVNKELNVTRS